MRPINSSKNKLKSSKNKLNSKKKKKHFSANAKCNLSGVFSFICKNFFETFNSKRNLNHQY